MGRICRSVSILDRGGLSRARARADAGGFAGPCFSPCRRSARPTSTVRSAARSRSRRKPRSRPSSRSARACIAPASRKLVIINSHGGNIALIDLAARQLRVRHAMLAVHCSWGRFGYPEGLFTAAELTHGIHGGEIETSIMLAAYPELVRRDRIADFRPATYAMERDYAICARTSRRLRLDDAGSASLRRGRRRDPGHGRERRSGARSWRARLRRTAEGRREIRAPITY